MLYINIIFRSNPVNAVQIEYCDLFRNTEIFKKNVQTTKWIRSWKKYINEICNKRCATMRKKAHLNNHDCVVFANGDVFLPVLLFKSQINCSKSLQILRRKIFLMKKNVYFSLQGEEAILYARRFSPARLGGWIDVRPIQLKGNTKKTLFMIKKLKLFPMLNI